MKNIFLLFAVLFLITGCKKYPEDDVFIQWKKPEKRLIKWSPWTFESLKENDVDISNNYKNDSAYVSEISFNKRETSSDVPVSVVNNYASHGGYVLSNDDNNIVIGVTDFYNNTPGIFYFLFTDEINWEIRELDKKRFILEGTYQNKKYRLTYKN